MRHEVPRGTNKERDVNHMVSTVRNTAETPEHPNGDRESSTRDELKAADEAASLIAQSNSRRGHLGRRTSSASAFDNAISRRTTRSLHGVLAKFHTPLLPRYDRQPMTSRDVKMNNAFAAASPRLKGNQDDTRPFQMQP